MWQLWNQTRTQGMGCPRLWHMMVQKCHVWPSPNSLLFVINSGLKPMTRFVHWIMDCSFGFVHIQFFHLFLVVAVGCNRNWWGTVLRGPLWVLLQCSWPWWQDCNCRRVRWRLHEVCTRLDGIIYSYHCCTIVATWTLHNISYWIVNLIYYPTDMTDTASNRLLLIWYQCMKLLFLSGTG